MATTVKELITRLGFSVDQDKVDAYDRSISQLKVGLLAVTAATAGVVASAFAIARSASKAGDEVAKTSAVLGISIQAFQSYRHAADLAGVSNEGFTTSMQFFTRNIGDAIAGVGEAKKAFETLGVSQAQLKGLGTEEVFRLVADSMSEIKSPAQIASLSMDLFGRSGLRMGTFLSKGSAELDRATQAVRLFGFFGDESAKQAEEVNDAITRMNAIFGGLRNEIGIRLFPVLLKITDAMEAWFTRNADVIKQRIDQVFARAVPLAKALGAAIVALGAAAVWGAVAAGIKLVSSLGTAFLVAWGKALLGPALIAAAVFLVILAVDEMWTTIKGGETIINDFNRWIADLVAGGSKVAAFFDGVLEVIAGFWSVVAGLFTGNKSLVLAGFRTMFSDLVESVKQGIRALMELVPEPIRKAAGLVGRALTAGVPFSAGAAASDAIFGPPGSFAGTRAPSPIALAGSGASTSNLNVQGGAISVQVMPGTTAGQAQDVGRAVEEAQRRANRDLAMEIKRRGAP
jgi:hypothetical protein